MSDYRFSVGTFARKTTVGNQTVSVQDANGAFAIKGIIFWSTIQSTNGFQSVMQHFQGFTDGVNSRVMATYAPDNQPNNNAPPGFTVCSKRSVMGKSHPILVKDSTPTSTTDNASIVSLDTGSFTIKWNVTTGLPWNIHYLAIGGADTTCVVGTQYNPVSTGNQSVTVTGIGQITGLITMQVFADNVSTSIPGTGLEAALTPNLGFTDGTNMGAISTQSKCIITGPEQSYRCQRTDRFSMINNVLKSPVEQDAVSITSLGSGTFTANWLTTSGLGPFGTAGLFYLAIAGPRIKVGSVNQRTTVGSTDIALSWNPGAFLAFSDGHAASTSNLSDTQYSLGAYDGINHAENWISDLNGAQPSAASRENRDDRVITCATVTGVNAAVTLNSYATAAFGTSKVTLTWPTVDATARQILYMAFESSVTIVSNLYSGIYKLVPNKHNDTVYTAFSPVSTESVAIPEPFGETALIGDDQ